MKFFVLGVCLLGVMPVVGAEEGKCPDPKAVQALAPHSHRVKINLCSGEVTGTTTLRTRDSVQLLLVNKKPVGAKYEVKQEMTVIPEEAMQAFLAILMPASLVGGKQGDSTGPDTKSKGTLLQAMSALGSLGARTDAVKSLLALDVEEVLKLKNSWDQAYTRALSISSQAGYAPNTPPWDTLVPVEFDKLDFAATGQEFLSLEKLANQCRRTAEASRDFVAYDEAKNILEKTLPDWRRQLESLIDTVKKVNENRLKLKGILESEVSYYQIISIPTGSDPRVVTITVTETPVEPKDAKSANIYTVKLQFGSARFSLSGGMVASVLDREEYQISQGFVRDRKGNIVTDATGVEKTGPVVSIKEQSGSTLLPIAILHANLWDFQNGVGVHLSTGVTAKSDNKGTSVEYLFGPSFSFLDRHFFLTGGAFAARRQILADGLFLGAPADKLTAEGLASKHLNWGWGFAISYKLK